MHSSCHFIPLKYNAWRIPKEIDQRRLLFFNHLLFAQKLAKNAGNKCKPLIDCSGSWQLQIMFMFMFIPANSHNING